MARLGSFAAPVDLSDALRPWRAAGLESLFLPDGLSDSLAKGTLEVSSPAPQALGQDLTTPALPQPSPVQHGSGSMAAPLAPPSISPLDLDWPEPWRSIASRVRSKPQIIITYASLAEDVSGKGDPLRRKLFQSILSYMNWPQGTSLFWPCTLAAQAQAGLNTAQAPDPSRNIFLNGVLSFGVAFVACFGSEAAQIGTALFPPGAGDPEVRVLCLPEPEELIGLLPHELHRAVAVLKALPLA